MKNAAVSRTILAILIIALAPIRSVGQDITFHTPATQPLSGVPSAAATGDLNGDDRPDLVVAIFLEATVSVFLAGGDEFEPLIPIGDFPAGGPGRALLIQDLDEDEIADVLVSEEESDNIWLLHGFGDGTFAEPSLINPGHDPVGVAAANLDSDGHLDLAVAMSDEEGGFVSILRGLGEGVFETFGSTPLPDGCEAVVAHDFDGDGILDLAVSSSATGEVSILYGEGEAIFSAPVTLSVGPGTAPLLLGDVDEDGFADLIAGNTGNDTVSILRSRGDGDFDPPVAFPTNGSSLQDIRVADANDDSHLDIWVVNQRSQSVSVLLGDGDGGFGPVRGFVAGATPLAFGLLDVDGDGNFDAVTTNEGSDGGPELAFLLGNGAGDLGAPEQLPAARSASGAAVADFDDDGIADVALTFNDVSQLAVFASGTDGGRTALLIDAESPAAGLAAADLNGDQRIDIATANTTPALAVFLASGPGVFLPPVTIDLGVVPNRVVTADLDGDGDPELIATAGSPPRLLVARNEGTGTFTLLAPTLFEGQPAGLIALDFNDDQRTDIAVADTMGQRILLFASTGDATFDPQPPITVGGAPGAMALLDAEGDGDDDLAISNLTARQGRLLLKDDLGSFTIGGAVFGGQFPVGVATRDLDGDGLADALFADQTGDAVGITMNVGGALVSVAQPRAGLRPLTIVTGDFDGDGDYDALSAGTTVVRLTNTTDAAFPARSDGNGDDRISVADITALLLELTDGDGTRSDDVSRGSFAGASGVDSDGDGIVDQRDLPPLLRRLIPS